MEGDKDLFLRVYRRDLLVGLPIPLVGLATIILVVLLLVVLQEFGLDTGKDATGWYGLAILGCAIAVMLCVSRRLARRFGIACPECGKIISYSLMKSRDRRYFWRTWRCPYCSRN